VYGLISHLNAVTVPGCPRNPRHEVNPGITGLAQAIGYSGETSTVDATQKRVEYNLEYLRNWSLMLDLRKIVRTIRVALDEKMAL